MDVISVGGHSCNIRPCISTHTHTLLLSVPPVHRYRQFKTFFLIFRIWVVLYANRLLQRLLQLQISADAREGHHCSLHCLHAAQVHMLPTPGVANVMTLHWFCPTRWLVFILFRELCQGFSLLWCEKCVSFSAHFKQILPHMIRWLRRVYCPLKDFF